MCGIAGGLSTDGGGNLRRDVLEMMGLQLAHRGPDEDVAWIGGGVGLTVRRLKIVDLVGGQQPLVSEDGAVRLVANGEIYNAPALRRELEARGHVFGSHTDIEVIVHAYEEEGIACLERLDGMFAIALWDSRRRRLLLARDRFGEKPLYVARARHVTLFASELKALLVHPDVSRSIDWNAFVDYLLREYVPSPRTIFRDIRKIPPAHWLAVDADGRETLQRYWAPPVPSDAMAGSTDVPERVLSLLRESVRRRIVCDVPWGTFLSGGIDSGLLTALAVEIAPARVQTFAIGFEEATYDERSEAAQLARALGTEHHEIELRSSDAVDLLPEVARIFDEPFADPSAVPALLLSRFAREHVTVTLSGEGGDELFGGYPTQRAHHFADLYRRVPWPLRGGIERLAQALPVSHRYLSWDFAVRRFLDAAAEPPLERHMRWMGSFVPERLDTLLTRDARAAVNSVDPYGEARETIAALHPGSSSDVATALDLRFYLADDNLTQTDRASMAASLEVRSPFLDRQLAEFVLALPTRLRCGWWETKPLLRAVAHRLLPPNVARRPKHGFGVPTGQWLRTELRGMALDHLSPERLHKQGLFDPARVSIMLDQHLTGVANHRKELWTLLMFQLWAATYCGQ
jgi:asparagine synthase (glutamine-hydrolysing)